jgi:hypothetical protein
VFRPPQRGSGQSVRVAARLSGTWSGRYGGANQGTFVLQWVQTGSRLAGTIWLSTPHGTNGGLAGDSPIHGTVNGSAIRFATPYSMGITWSGTVSGTSMSGSYQVYEGGGSASGPWTATESG